MTRLWCFLALLVVPFSLLLMLSLCLFQALRKILPDMWQECREHWHGAVKLIEGVFR